MILVQLQRFFRSQATLTRVAIEAIYLTQHRQNTATFGGEILLHIHNLPTSMREAVGQQDLALAGNFEALGDSASHI